jgi:peptidoglycan LD-endopeptidase CwlK
VPTTTPPAASEAQAAKWKADERSEKHLVRLDPLTEKLAREHLRRLVAEGLNFKITSGLRTFAEQEALYAQGRTAPGPRVTNARAGSSWHNFGLAYDLTLFVGKTPKWDGPEYDRAGKIGQELGLEWGGAWKSFKDRPHFQRNIGLTLADARKKWPTGVTPGSAL